MANFFSAIGRFIKTPPGVIFAVNVVWHIVVLAMDIEFNYIVSGVILMVDIVIAYYLLDRLTYFFSQFVLPIQNPKDRREIYTRVKNFETGSRGPAIFIKNGQLIYHEGEMERRGPGLIVLDTASAAVLRTDTEIRDTVGPGVKFTKPNEYIAGSVDLRQQWQFIGPNGDGQKTDAVTRDEMEIQATISIKFSIRRPKEKKPTESGVISEYGYDEEAARSAITREFIETDEEENANIISWQEIPADLVVGIWREYVHKFKLAELFATVNEKGQSGLQVIEEMINHRVRKPSLQAMDNIGNLTSEWIDSREYAQLQKHGLEISEVRIHNVHLHGADEEQILAQWKPEWMKSIQQEEKALNETEALLATMAREESSKRFATLIAKSFTDAPAVNPFRTLEALIKPIKEYILNQTMAGNDGMDARLRKLNEIWKWLIDNDAEFTRAQGGK